MASRDVLIITDAAAPLVEGESPLGAAGLGRAFAASGRRANVLCLSSPDRAAQVPGLARRLRTIKSALGGSTSEYTLFEGRAMLSNAQLLVVAGKEPESRVETAAVLAAAVRSLADDGLINADVAIGWGESSALALATSPAPVRLFVLPTGRAGAPLSDAEMELLGTATYGDDVTAHSLAALGAASAHAVVSPSPSAARWLEGDPGLASRASDEPIVSVRFGGDESPNDPANDPALPAPYSAASLAGKNECRKVIARRVAAALGPRTLLLGTAPLRKEKGGAAVVSALQRLTDLDVVVVVPAAGDDELLERARLLAIEHPGRIAILTDPSLAMTRLLRAGADAWLLADDDDRTARAAGRALVYGTLPIAVARGANGDFLVDYDPRSRSGVAILYDAVDPFLIESAVRRAVALKAQNDSWGELVNGLLRCAPRWSATANALDELCTQFG